MAGKPLRFGPFAHHDRLPPQLGQAIRAVVPVHSPLTLTGAANSPSHTKPGGYIELQEMDYKAVMQPTTRNPGTSLMTWCTQQNLAAKKVGINLRTSTTFLKDGLEAAGFVDITVHEFKLPAGPWPKQKRLRDAGLLQLSAMIDGIEGLSLRLLKFYDGWTLDEVQVLLAKVRTELRDPGCHAYWPL